MGIDHSNPYIHSTTVLCDTDLLCQVVTILFEPLKFTFEYWELFNDIIIQNGAGIERNEAYHGTNSHGKACSIVQPFVINSISYNIEAWKN